MGDGSKNIHHPQYGKLETATYKAVSYLIIFFSNLLFDRQVYFEIRLGAPSNSLYRVENII